MFVVFVVCSNTRAIKKVISSLLCALVIDVGGYCTKLKQVLPAKQKNLSHLWPTSKSTTGVGVTVYPWAARSVGGIFVVNFLG